MVIEAEIRQAIGEILVDLEKMTGLSGLQIRRSLLAVERLRERLGPRRFDRFEELAKADPLDEGAIRLLLAEVG